MESVEPRLLLSTTQRSLLTDPGLVEPRLATPALVSLPPGNHLTHVEARVPRVKKVSTQDSGVSGLGVQGATATLNATLTSNGAPLPGRTIHFKVQGRNVGKATTDANGVAILSGARLKGIRSGVNGRGVTAVFNGDPGHKRSTARGELRVSQFGTSISNVSASGVYGGNGLLTATPTASNGPVAGQAVHFRLNGKDVGQADTKAQGVATLGNVNLAGINAGIYAGAVTASFTDGAKYQQSVAFGTLTVGQVQAIVHLSNQTPTYDGTAKAPTVSMSPAGPAYSATYTDASGNAVTSPKAVGTYTVHVTITNTNYKGDATGSFVIAPAPVSVAGIAAKDKVYDGTTASTLSTAGASLVGVVSGDDVTLQTSQATGSFVSAGVGTAKTVSIGGLTLGGTAAGNYVLVQPTTTADITAATLTVHGVTANNKPYDGTTNATLNVTGTPLAGVVSSDNVNVTLNTSAAAGTFDSSDPGTGETVTVAGLTPAGSAAGNDVLVQPTTTADITAATVTVTGITATGKVYDGTTDATINTSGAALSGVASGDNVTLDLSGATRTFSSKDAGPGKTVTIAGLTLSGADAGNYILVQPTTTADVTAATLTVTGITADDNAFDGTTDATLETRGAVLVGVVSGDGVTLDVSGAVGTFDSPDPGTDKTVFITGLVITGAYAGDYVLVEPTTTTSIT